MTPLSREEREAVLSAHPAAEPGQIESDLNEYEALVAAQFAVDPSITPAFAPLELGIETVRSSRLAELHAKLFGNR